MEKNIRARAWVFTLNNYTEEEEENIKKIECKWLIFGHEHTSGDGTPHLQGAIVFENARYFKALKALIPRAHIEKMNGTFQQSKDYCTKEDKENYFEKGEMPKDKDKNLMNKEQWEEMRQLAIKGDFDKIPAKYWIRYQNSFKQIHHDAKKDPDQSDFTDYDLKHHFLWLWGPTGTGKSHSARRIANELDCASPFMKDLNKWWNGYEHQKVTIIEEACPKKCEYLADYFKKWLDKWSFSAECKGSVIQGCRPEYIIVTSNYCIRECFPDERDYEPLERRCTEICLNTRGREVQWPYTQAERDLMRQTDANVQQTELTLTQSHSGNTIALCECVNDDGGRTRDHDPSEDTMTFELEEPPLTKRSRLK